MNYKQIDGYTTHIVVGKGLAPPEKRTHDGRPYRGWFEIGAGARGAYLRSLVEFVSGYGYLQSILKRVLDFFLRKRTSLFYN